MRARFAVLLLLATALAGCTGDGDDPETPPDTEVPPVDPPDEEPEPVTEYPLMSRFTIEGCSGVRFVTTTDMDTAAALLPDGYMAAPADTTAPVPVQQAQSATVGVDLYNCTTFSAGRYLFDDVWLGLAFVVVEPPGDAREADTHAYIVEMVAAEDVLSAIWPVAGFIMHNGTAAMQENEVSRGVSAGEYDLDTSTVVSGASAAVLGTFTWYHELDNGDRLTWTGERSIPAGAGGGALLSIPEDSPFAVVSATGQPVEGQGAAIDAAAFTEMDLIVEVAEYRQ